MKNCQKVIINMNFSSESLVFESDSLESRANHSCHSILQSDKSDSFAVAHTVLKSNEREFPTLLFSDQIRVGSCTLERVDKEVEKVERELARVLENGGHQLDLLFLQGVRHKIPEYGRCF